MKKRVFTRTVWLLHATWIGAVAFLAGIAVRILVSSAGAPSAVREAVAPATVKDTFMIRPDDVVAATPSLPYRLVNIRDVNAAIGIDLKYATTDNFTGQVLYDEDWDACLQEDVAEMLSAADKYLHAVRPDLRLLVYDAARPLSVQRRMWEQVKDTPYRNYVANPGRTGLHNYGAAVDLTLADSAWTPLDMGTPFDHFGKAAGIDHEAELVDQRLLTVPQVNNRKLLREVMTHAGFLPISGEWWHFNACPLEEAKQRYPLVE